MVARNSTIENGANRQTADPTRWRLAEYEFEGQSCSICVANLEITDRQLNRENASTVALLG